MRPVQVGCAHLLSHWMWSCCWGTPAGLPTYCSTGYGLAAGAPLLVCPPTVSLDVVLLLGHPCWSCCLAWLEQGLYMVEGEVKVAVHS